MSVLVGRVGIQGRSLILVRHSGLSSCSRIVRSRRHRARSVSSAATPWTARALLITGSVSAAAARLASTALGPPTEQWSPAAAGTRHQEKDTTGESCEPLHD